MIIDGVSYPKAEDLLAVMRVLKELPDKIDECKVLEIEENELNAAIQVLDELGMETCGLEAGPNVFECGYWDKPEEEDEQ